MANSSVSTVATEPLPPLLENPHLRRWGPAAAIALLTFLFFLPALRGVYIWDDDQWLTRNPTMTDPHGLVTTWTSVDSNPQYYPLVFTTFWLEYRLWKLDPVGYHVDNLLMHIAAALVLFALIKRLRLPSGPAGAWLAAMIFAIHPTTVESVAWVAERKNVLCALFFFASLYFTCDFFRLGSEQEAEKHRLWRRSYIMAIVCFLAAMLSKTIACPLPVVMLVMIWWRRGRISRREWLLTIPFFLIAITLGIITTHTEHGAVGTTGAEWIYSPLGRDLFNHREKATAWLKLLAMGQEFLLRSQIASQAVWFYLWKIFVPFPVVQIYRRFSFALDQPLLYLAPAALLVMLGALLGLRKWISRGPVAALVIFILVLGPALGFINFYTMIYTFVADHYQYLALPAIVVLAVETLALLLRKASAAMPTDLASREAGATRFYNLAGALLMGGITLSLGSLTYAVSELYASAELLWKFNVEVNPTAYAAWYNLAMAMLNRPATTPAEIEQKRADAIDVCQQSISYEPNDWRAYHALGMIYLDEGKPELAQKFLDRGEALMPPFVRAGRADFFEKVARYPTPGTSANTDAAYYSPNFLLGRNYEDHEQWDKAIAYFTADLAANPLNPETEFHLGNSYIGKNNFLDAITAFTHAIEKRPAYAEAYFNRGVCLRAVGKEKEGVADLLKARDLDPMVLRHIPALLNVEAARFRRDDGPTTLPGAK